jgi:APA family basic amino acid/polyamine antiporter
VNWKHIFARKDLEVLLAEAAGEHRLHRVLGPWSLTALGVGCIIGAGIFVVTGRAAALDAGPGVILSYAIAGVGCALAALCYAEFAAMAPVAGSAYTYAYTTLGEIFAWIIGWDLILEYAMGCATVASAWTSYLNKLLAALNCPQVPYMLCNPPWTVDGSVPGIVNLPSVLIMAVITTILVLGIRESARTNATLVAVKLAVVVFVIFAGWSYVNRANWTTIPVAQRRFPQEEEVIPDAVNKHLADRKEHSQERVAELEKEVIAAYRIDRKQRDVEQVEQAGGDVAKAREELAVLSAGVASRLPQTDADRQAVAEILPQVREQEEATEGKSWGILGALGLNRWLLPIDNATRSPFMPYGLSGIMLGAAIVFFAFIGFDSISTHAEEARRPQRDVPIGILVSLAACTLLYIVVAAVVTGMVPYPDIDIHAPIAAAFEPRPGVPGAPGAPDSPWLRFSRGLIAAGGLAGMTSVLLVLFLSQARIFMAMSRDGLLPHVFSTVHPRFRTPHVATILTGVVICVTAAFTPILVLTEMVNVGTLMAFVMVCAAVWVLRRQRPSAERPFRCPAIWLVAPAGMLINVTMTLFLSVATWLRLVIWLAAGLVIYFTYSLRHSHLARHLMQEIRMPRKEVTGTQFDPEVVE